MGANGTTKVTTLAQLAPRTEDYTITNSATGDEFVVTLRDLLPEQVARIDASVKQPKPRIKEFKPGGVPVFDEDDPAYLEAREIAINERVYRWLFECWVIDYPADADTPEKKLECIKTLLPFWAFNELSRRMREVNGLKMSDVALQKKISNQTPGAN